MSNLRKTAFSAGFLSLVLASVSPVPVRASVALSINGQEIQDNGAWDSNQLPGVVQVDNFSPQNSPPGTTVSAQLRLETDPLAAVARLVLTDAVVFNDSDAVAPIDFDFRGDFAGQIPQLDPPAPRYVRQHLAMFVTDPWILPPTEFREPSEPSGGLVEPFRIYACARGQMILARAADQSTLAGVVLD